MRALRPIDGPSYRRCGKSFLTTLCLLTLILLAALSGCATGSGSLFDGEVRASTSRRQTESPDEDGGPDEGDEAEEARPGLSIRTSPNRAQVFINGRSHGRSPMRLELPTGRYRIYAQHDGYRPAQVTVSYTAGTAQELRLELQEITGRLRVDVQPRDARVRIGFRDLQPGRTHEMRVGSYTVDIGAFGYEPVRRTVVVRDNRTSTVSITLKQAAFRVQSFSPRTTCFSPYDPGRLGSAAVQVGVSAPGRAEYRVFDARSRQVSEPVSVFFSQAMTTLTWDGRDRSGLPVPDGAYRLVLTGDDGARETAHLTVDSRIARRLRPVFGSAAGTLFSPLPASLPRGTHQMSFLGVAHASRGAFMAPVLTALRFGVGRRQEFVVAAGGIIRGPDDLAADSVGFLSASWSLPLFHSPGASASVIVRASAFGDDAIDPFENATGVGTAVPLSTTFGPLTLALTPELVVAAGGAGAAADPDAPEAGIGSAFSLFGYGRAAAVLDFGRTSLAASGALRLRPLGSPPGPDWPASVGIELHRTFPEELFSLSAIGTLRWHPTEGWYISTGLGFQAFWW